MKKTFITIRLDDVVEIFFFFQKINYIYIFFEESHCSQSLKDCISIS